MKNLSKILWILGIFYFCMLPVRAEGAPLKVQLYPDQNSVKPGMMFLVRARVSNTQEASLDLWCRSCSYEKNWVADIPEVFIQPWTCSEDNLEKVTLNPGDVYEKTIILYITKKNSSGTVTFRLGFKQFLENGDEMEPVWSDPITMKVWIPEGEMPAEGSVGSGIAPVQTLQNNTSAVEISESMPDSAAAPDDETGPESAQKIP